MENKGQGIFYGVIGVATLIVAIIGATFAFFAASASNDTAINGTTATAAQLTLTVTHTAPATAAALIPLDNATQMSDALGTTKGASCIDSNGNAVCEVYTIQITNGGSATAVLNGTLNLTSTAAMKWKVIPSATTDNSSATVNSTGTAGTIVSNLSLGGSQSETYYVVVWLQEAGSDQTPADANKTFTGVVTFDGGDNTGVTATFTAG